MKTLTGAALLCSLLVIVTAENPWMITATDIGTAIAQSNRFTGLENQTTIEAWFEQWKVMHQKVYGNTAARQQALANFRSTLMYVHKTNTDLSATLWVSVGPFADLSYDQFKATVLMRHWNASIASLNMQDSIQRRRLGEVHPLPSRRLLSTTVDWRSVGKVTPIKNQGQCGSCWAFAATAAIESAYYISQQTNYTTKYINLAEQQMVDCATQAAGYSSLGCNGGYCDAAIKYVYKVNETTEARYPYKATNNTCNMTAVQGPAGTAVKLNASVTYLPYNSYSALMTAVKKQPVIIYFDAEKSFQAYSGGVYTADNCTTATNHAMLVVGFYWTGATNSSYWIIKNSWGTGWGESGYVRVNMSSNATTGPCGMYQYPMVPTLTNTTFTQLLG